MSNFRLVEYIEHIAQYAQEILDFSKGVSESIFKRERMIQQAICMNVITIGEIAASIQRKYPDFVDTNHTLPWREMAQTRHKMVHGYHEIDLGIIWDTVQNDIPLVVQAIPIVLEEAKEYEMPPR